MGSIKSRLVLALGVVQLMTLAMALVLYVGARRLEEDASHTRQANDEVRELLSFALITHRYVNAFGQSLGQRTLIANHERRASAAAFEARIRDIEPAPISQSGWKALDWGELRRISSDLNSELQVADALRERGMFLEAERTFSYARKMHFDRRMLPWFDSAIEALHNNVDALEFDAIEYASGLRAAGTALGGISALLASVAVFAISRSILRPVSALVAGTEQIAQSNLSYRVPVHGSDELTLLAKRFNEMADTIATSQAKLIERNAELEEAYRLQSDFLSIVSHELRSPLHSILGYTDLLLEDETGISEQSSKNLSAIGGSARRLLGLINEILDFSRLTAGQMNAHSDDFELLPLLKGALEDARALARGRPVELVLDAPEDRIVLRSDAEKVTQILTNLLSNAVKFTDTGTVTLRAGVLPDGVELEVSDTGIGIPDEQLGIIFEPFRQAKSANKRGGSGTGLGLAIVSRLTELLGGRISIKSEVGRGTRLSVFLPNTA
jgi:signal transduction histidine kinase